MFKTVFVKRVAQHCGQSRQIFEGLLWFSLVLIEHLNVEGQQVVIYVGREEQIVYDFGNTFSA